MSLLFKSGIWGKYIASVRHNSAYVKQNSKEISQVNFLDATATIAASKYS